MSRCVGKSVTRVDAYDKATGRAKYMEDLCDRSALIARVLHSTIAHGFVKSIDTGEAEAIPGVVRILTCFDVPERPFPTAGHPWSTDPHHQDVADRMLLNRHVRYYGDEVAVVIAEDEISAVQGVRALQVEYEDALYPVKCHKNDSIAAVKKAIRSVTPITTTFYLVFNHAVLSDVELVRFQLKDGSRVSVCVDPSQPSLHTSSSSSYHSRAPTLHNPEYTISPSIEELKSLMNCELACVKNVSIERKGVGRIEWLEGVDLRDVAIDEVVEIERDEGGAPSIAVYYNDDEHSASYPRPGTGLNHPAILTFFGIKAKHLRDKDAFVSFLKLESVRATDPELAKKYAEVLYNQALLIAGLPLADPSGYTDLVCSLWS